MVRHMSLSDTNIYIHTYIHTEAQREHILGTLSSWSLASNFYPRRQTFLVPKALDAGAFFFFTSTSILPVGTHWE